MDFEDNGFGGSAMEQNEALANIINPPDTKKAEETAARDAVIESLKKQILGQGLTDKWKGEGLGSADANARQMAEIMADTGITDIKQFGPITKTIPGYSYETEQGTVDVPEQTVSTFGNKETGKEVANTYSERQSGNAFGGTFEGSGNTGYRVQFGPDGTPYFYTTQASSNDLANLMQDLGPIGQIGLALATGGLSIPQQIAAKLAVNVLSGQDIGDAIKGAAISMAVSNIPGTDLMKSGGTFIKELKLDDAVTKTLTNSFQNAVTSGATAALTGRNVGDAMMAGAATGGVNGAVNALLNSSDMKELTSDLSDTEKRLVANTITGVISGKPLDQVLINTAIAAANAEAKANAPISAKELGQLDADEKKKYEESGTKGLRTFQQQINNLERLTTSGRTGDDMGGGYDTANIDTVSSGISSDVIQNLENAGLTTNTEAEELARVNAESEQVKQAIAAEDARIATERQSEIARQADEARQAQEDELVILAKPKADEEAVKNAEVTALEKSGLTPAEQDSKTLFDLNAVGGAGTEAETGRSNDPNVTVTGDKAINAILEEIFQNATPNTDSGLSNDDILRMINAPADDTVTVTTPKGPDGYTEAERESKRIQDLIAVGGDPNENRVVITDKRPTPEEPVAEPIFQTPVKPNAPNLGNLGEMVITTDRPPQPNLNLTTDPVSLLTDPLAPTTLPTPVTKPEPVAKPSPFANIDPIQALQEFYNPFKPAQSAKPPSQTDTGPIQLMTDIFGTDISKAQKTGARGYGFSAGGDIDELLRLLRS